ncbi:MAG: CinA family protein [Candidatus Thioglobus sp.]|nr:MAG: CinA family protein [Candidatus Thioglobus sp.]
MKKLANLLTQKNLTIAVAESCTGGNLSAFLTNQSGASAYFDRGFITYSNQAKIDTLGVSAATLNNFGAVSEQTALEMSRGVIKNAKSDIAIAITGIAGPTGGTTQKPVGTVCFGFCIGKNCQTSTQHFQGSRSEIVQSSVDFAISFLQQQLL